MVKHTERASGMTSETLYRLAGGGLIIGALVAGAGGAGRALLSELGPPQSFAAAAAAVVAFVANMGLLICLPAIAARQARRAGLAGLAGYVLFALALLSMGVGMEMIFGLLFPSLPPAMTANPPAGVLVTFALTELTAVAGLGLLGVATLRARVFPSWTGGALIASAVVLVVADLPARISFGAGLQMVTETLHYVFFTAALIGMAVTLIRGDSVSAIAERRMAA